MKVTLPWSGKVLCDVWSMSAKFAMNKQIRSHFTTLDYKVFFLLNDRRYKHRPFTDSGDFSISAKHSRAGRITTDRSISFVNKHVPIFLLLTGVFFAVFKLKAIMTG